MGEIIVAGGGPAGCMAARSAALNGSGVTVYEEHDEIGRPVQCSGLVSKKGLDTLGIDYSKAILNGINGADIHADGTSLRIEAKEAKAYVIDRAEFDVACALAAESEGARLLLGERAPKPNGSVITIGADGVFSPTAETSGFPRFPRMVCCYQEELSGLELQSAHRVSVYLSNTLFPGFFGWVIPTNSESARVGLGLSFGNNPRKRFHAFLTKLGLDGKARRTSSLGGCIPLFPRSRTVIGRTMLVGDAAGQVKALSGGGIYIGCNCAAMAGRIASTTPGALEAYEREWRGQFSRDLVLHREMRRVMDMFPDRLKGVLMRAGKLAGAEGFLVKYGDMDRPTEIAKAVKRDSVSRLSKSFNNLMSIFSPSISGKDDSRTYCDNP